MKTFRSSAALFLLLVVGLLPARPGAAAVTITNINLGTAANDGTGDTLRSALTKVMTNFHRLNYGKLESTNGAASTGNVLTSDGTNWYGAAPTGSGSGGAGSFAANANQIDTNNPASIKSGSLQTNNLFYGYPTFIGDAFFQGVTRMSNNAVISGELQLGAFVNVEDTISEIAPKQYGSAVLTNISGTGAHTNKINKWDVWSNPAVTNSYFAANYGLGITSTNTTNFGSLLQSIYNRGVDAGFIKLHANPYYTNHYELHSTVIITNMAILEGEGNSATTIRAGASLNAPAFQLGEDTGGVRNGGGGIFRVKNLRFEGDLAGVNGVGFKVLKCAEFIGEFCEWTGFRKAGIEFASTNYVHWSYLNNCWFVQKYANTYGLYISAGPVGIDADANANHLVLNNCEFGTFGGGDDILVEETANFNNLAVIDSIFKHSFGTHNHGMSINNGRGFIALGNQFINYQSITPIYFASGVFGAHTNLNPTFYQNKSDGTVPVVTIGDYVTNITVGGNAAKSGPALAFDDISHNGSFNNLDNSELRLGTLNTNAILVIGANGLVNTGALSGATFSAGTLTVSQQTNASIVRQTELTAASNALVSFTMTASNNVYGTETTRNAAVSNALVTLSSNNVRVAAGTGISVASAGSAGVQTFTVTATGGGGGAGSLPANANQISTNSILTIIERAELTNIFVRGTGAVFSGHVTVNSNITAQSFTGSGTGVPIIRLQTMMSADNALAFYVRTNFTQLSSNTFEFGSPAAGQKMKFHSVGNGQIVITNSLDVEMPTQGLLSNVTQVIYQMHSGSVVGANSNQTIWLGQTNVSDLLISTNVTFTNFNGITAGRSANFTAFMKVTNAAANVGVNWGNLGGSNPGYSVAIWTNANAPMWTTLTNTKTYVLSVTSRGTNLHPTLTLWE